VWPLVNIQARRKSEEQTDENFAMKAANAEKPVIHNRPTHRCVTFDIGCLEEVGEFCG
jgi:hypothetical protein